MKLLVTGATGFVGYHFAKYAKTKGYQLTCTVRDSSNTGKLEELGVELCRVDLNNLTELEGCLAATKPDFVIHCAGCVVATHAGEFTDSNVNVTRNICEASIKQKVKRLVYISSVDVNSGNDELPIVENLPYVAVNPYGQSKIDAEKLVIEFQSRGLESVILRPTTIIGEGEPHGMPKLLPLIRNRKLPWPNLPELKDQIHIVYIGNLVEALEVALTKPEAANEIFNICDAQPSHIKELLDIMVEELACKKPRVMPSWLVKTFLLLPPLKKGFFSVFRDWQYDISKAQQLLGYQPSVSSEEAVRRTVRYWIEHQQESG